MKNTLILVLFPLFAIGVFGESVSVKEGDSVTLLTGVQIQGNDLMEWRFNGKLIFRISSSAGVISVSDRTDGAFRDRLKVDRPTGDLKIANFRNTDAGEYLLKIRSSTSSEKTFSVTGESNADRDPVKSVTVGESITLKTQIQSDEVKWRFGAENILIAEINLMADRIPQYHDVLDGRFRDRLKLDNHTGSLTITNITDTHSGVYEAEISSSVNRYTIHKIFNVTVEGVKSVSVMEGDSVSLSTGVAKIQRADVIEWKFGDQDVIIVRLNGPDVFSKWSNVNLNKQTGNLTINNIKRDQSGDYKVQIDTINVISCRKYHINISAIAVPSPKSTETYSFSTGIGIGIGIGIVIVLVPLIMFIIIGIKKGWFSSSSRNNVEVNGQNHPVKEEETELSK